MRISIIFILLCLISSSTKAQDLIVLKKGDPIKAYSVEVGDKYIYYQLSKSNSEQVSRALKDDVIMIRKEDGTVINMTETITTQSPVAKPFSKHPIIPNESLTGLLIEKGNCVYIPTDGPTDYEMAGQKMLKELVERAGYWVVVDYIEQSHFVLQFRTIEEGLDRSEIIIRTRDKYKEQPIAPLDCEKQKGTKLIGRIRSSENINDNKKVAATMWNLILPYLDRLIKSRPSTLIVGSKDYN